MERQKPIRATILACRDVHEYIFATVVGLDKSKPLDRVEPLLGLGRELDLAAQFQSLCVEN